MSKCVLHLSHTYISSSKSRIHQATRKILGLGQFDADQMTEYFFDHICTKCTNPWSHDVCQGCGDEIADQLGYRLFRHTHNSDYDFPTWEEYNEISNIAYEHHIARCHRHKGLYWFTHFNKLNVIL